jgi:hypothetical protein
MQGRTTHVLVMWLLFTASSFFTLGCGNQKDSGPETAQEELFTDANDEANFMRLSSVDEIETLSLKRRFVRVNAKTLKRIARDIQVGEIADIDVELKANFFEDDMSVIVLEQVEKHSPDNFSFTGRIRDQLDSAVTLVYNEGVVAANIRREGESASYEVRYSKDGIHLVNLMQDSDDGCEAVEDPDGDEEIAQDSDFAALSHPVIDILAVYTPNARIRRGGRSGIVALIQLGIADTNRAFYYSGVTTRVRLVGTMELNRNESGYWSSDLDYLKGKTDGRWDNVHSERARLGADQVSMVATYSSSSGTNGIGYIRSTTSSAFTIVRDSAFSVYTFAHELGHNIGLNHSDGYVNSSGRFRTIMAYGSYPRIRRFSNRYLTYSGYTTGNYLHNSVSIIRSRSSTMAGLLSTRVYSTSAADVRAPASVGDPN